MAQYLYAGYSLNENQPDEQKRSWVRKWKANVLEIAREEMGHLATVQNVLTVIGGPLCFERDDYPIQDDELWPFPFELEPLTKVSLGKYVLAESPSEEVLAQLHLKDEIEEIKKRVHAAADLNVHRVGLIYDAITKLFTAGSMIQGPAVPGITDTRPFIATVDIQASSLKFQVNPSAWGLGYKDILIEVAQDRPSAIGAISAIGVQGEGSTVESDPTKSHFGKFLSIYREFPEEGEWRPSRLVAVNPTTNPRIEDPARRLRGNAAVWAALSNLRYRMALMYLKHSFYIEAPADFPSRSPRGALVSWAFGEMYNIRSLSEILMSMPMSPGSQAMAGPPFEMPYSLALPARNADRWRAHRDLLTASITLIDDMLESEQEHDGYLRALSVSDQTTLEQVTTLIGA
jgi:rubrerythrin